MKNHNLLIGLIDIRLVNSFRKDCIKEASSYNPISLLENNKNALMNIYKISEPFLIQKKDEVYIHYILYGDILGCCYDLDAKLFYLFLNGEIINVFTLNIRVDANYSFLPFISVGNCMEIIF